MTAASSSVAPSSQLDVVFDGTWVIAPSVDATGNIVAVNVYSPACGHPHGATFRNQLNPNPWPTPPDFYMLDEHGHVLIIQRGSAPHSGMSITGIQQGINHCVTSARHMGNNWDLMISIPAGPDAWVSGDTVVPESTDPTGRTVPCFSGKDAPLGKVSSLQTLSFKGVTEVELCGAPARVQGLFLSPWSGNGTLIFEGEIPYVPTLQHERSAISAMANLAGLDLALDYPLPSSMSQQPAPPVLQPMLRTGGYCGHGLILMPS
ncbi:MAG: hypothetical protein WAM85_02690 [Terracidiphilus sp.]